MPHVLLPLRSLLSRFSTPTPFVEQVEGLRRSHNFVPRAFPIEFGKSPGNEVGVHIVGSGAKRGLERKNENVERVKE